MKALLPILLGFALVAKAFAAQGPCVVSGTGHFYIHTGTAGLFGAFAHEHLIEAKRVEGCAAIDPNDLTRSSIKLIFTTADIRVLDPKESVNDRAKVQETMQTEVLRISEYPQVVFESTAVERGSTAGALRIHGNLTIRGSTHPIIVPLTFVAAGDGGYRATGEYRFKQTTFGIKPIQLAGGTVKVKDEIRTEFELLLK